MAKPKPRVFVGSSSEGRQVAGAFCQVLKDQASCTPWWLSPSFTPGSSTLADLIAAANGFDFGLFIMTPDDVGTSRDQARRTIRDNVLFEYGLFIGVLGRDRTFAVLVRPSDGEPSVHIPTDLLGVNIPRLQAPREDDLLPEVNATVRPIAEIIGKLGRFERQLRLVRYHEFHRGIPPGISVGLDVTQLHVHKDSLLGKVLFVVARKQNAGLPFEDDPNIVVGARIDAPRHSVPQLVLEAKGDPFSAIAVGDIVEFYVMVAPKDFDFAAARTINAFLDHGCDRAGGGGSEIQ